MHHTHQDNQSFAQKVCDEVKKNVMCSNDIISRQELPFWHQNAVLDYKNKFGDTQLNELWRYMQTVHCMRQFLQQLAHSSSTITRPNAAGDLAITHLGFAECGELAHLVFLKLIEHGCQPCILMLENKKRYEEWEHNPNIRTYIHSVVILGDDKGYLDDQVSSFNTLPEEVVIIDPFLQYVGPAKTYFKDKIDYLQHFHFDPIFRSNFLN